MARKKDRPSPPGDAADIIAQGMTARELSNEKLARMLRTSPEVIESIVCREVPVPLMWVPNIADAIDRDLTRLMSVALGEQWLATLTAIAGTLLWEEGQVQRELIGFFTELGDGECPSLSDEPALARRLKEAFRDPDDDDDGSASAAH